MNHRGFMLDLARCLENRAYYRTFIDFIAARGATTLLLHFTDDQGCALQFDSIPELASPNAYSKAEMRGLIAYAAQRGVEIVPELAALGHARYITRLPQYRHLDEQDSHFTGMCPVSTETRDIFAKLIAEVAELFPSAALHVGLDEVNIGGHPLTAEALQTRSRGQIMADYVDFVHGVVTGLGKRMWMWGDGLLQDAEMLARVPRDVAVCNWQYTPDASTSTTKTLLDAGLNVVLFSAIISHDQTLFPGQFALPNLRQLESHRALSGRGKVLGHLTTIWTPVRFIADSLWLAVDYAAAVQRGEAADFVALSRGFAETFYGLSKPQADAFANVSAVLAELSPMRGEWLDVMKLKPLSDASLARVAASEIRWRRAREAVAELAEGVTQHHAEFVGFSLLMDLIAYAYDAAVTVAGGDLTRSTLAGLLDDGRRVFERVEKDWDRSRFDDDSRKWTAAIASFQNDHLLPLLHNQLTALRQKEREGNPITVNFERIETKTAPAR